MSEAILWSELGGFCVAGAVLYGAYLGVTAPEFQERIGRFRTVFSRTLPYEVWRRSVGRLIEPQSGADLAAIGRHASLAEGYDEAHCVRIGETCRRLAEACQLSAEETRALVEAAHLHDAGIEDWDVDMLQSGALPTRDRDRLAEHCARSENLARELAADARVSLWVRWHHERLDGSGYPDGLESDEIPLGAQILGLADAFEALTHPRPHRPAFEPRDAVAELQRLAGLQFDPGLVAAFVQRVYPRLPNPSSPV